MSKPKYATCKHSTGRAKETAVYVKESCPNSSKVHGHIVSTRNRCERCEKWEE